MRPYDALSIQRALQAGMQHHDAGRFAQAEAAYQEVLRLHPGNPDALALLGDLAHRGGRVEEAIACLREALRQRPQVAPLHHKLGLVLTDAGRLDAAEGAQRAALRLKPDYAEAWFHLGNLLAFQQRRAEAIPAYRRALVANPGFAAAHNNLAAALEAEGRWEEAIAAYEMALAADDAPHIGANLARCLAAAPRVPSDARHRDQVARAMEEAWLRPADLARLACGLLCEHPALSAAIGQAAGIDAAPVDASALLTPAVLDACVHERLLTALLTSAQASDARIERFLRLARHALLQSACGDADAGRAQRALPFACALAQQCYLNDYVFSCGAEEERRLERLRGEVRAALDAGETPTAAALAVLACYAPLADLPGAARLRSRPWPSAFSAVLAQQVSEPEEEAGLRATITSLTPIESDVSRRVQRQYEESPYPRWTRLPAPGPMPLDAYVRALFPAAPLPPRGTIADRDILVAGCGTGQEPVDLARQFPASRILALDLSRASLAYAMRKTREAGCANIEYAQGDLLALEGCGRAFDFISCMGVLHHLRDPAAGWRALASCLRPGGFMQVGLYSAAARRDISAARAAIAARGAPLGAADIRRWRDEMLADDAWKALTRLRDFYGLHECRDLLFHVEEHCTTLPALGATVAAAGLRFIGLAVPPGIARAFAQRFPDAAPDDLERWDLFESERPDTFAGMYLAWVQKPTA